MAKVTGSAHHDLLRRHVADPVKSGLRHQRKGGMMPESRVFSAIGIVAIVAAMVAALVAQTSDKPTFEVISIKTRTRAATGESGGTTIAFQPGGRFIALNTSVQSLLILAYRGDQFTLRPEQIDRVPAWFGSTLFDIEAKVAGEPSAVPIPMVPTGAALLRSLLEERFKLKAHIESREFSVYVLLLARGDGTLGPKLRPSVVDCKAQPLPLPPAGRPPWGVRRAYGTLSAGGATMTPLIGALGNAVGNAVLDRTGLTGSYDMELQWRQEGALTATPTASISDDPSIFTAVREQLGLKLESRREPMDVLVIEHVEQPSPN